MSKGALEGVKVIELGHMVALPSACAVLADSGAEVIKIENPKGGDPLRGAMQIEDLRADIPVWFENANRNKRSITLDVTQERSHAIICKLLEQADVFATNYEVSLLERINCDYETLSKINPKIIYALLTGYGTKGPDKGKPGFDYAAFWARSGIMDRIAEPNSDPRPQRAGLGDNLVSLAVSGAIGTALFTRERTGVGQKIDLSLYQVGVWGLGFDIEAALHFGKEMSRTDRKSVTNPIWNVYQTKDEKWMQFVMAQTDMYWPAFCRAIERTELIEQYDSHEKRMQANITLIQIIEETMATKTFEEWDEILKQNDVIYGVVQSPLDVINDQQALDNKFFAEIDHPVVGKFKCIESPINYSKTPASIRTAAPALGQHTEEVLLDLGYSWDDISELKSHGAIL